MAPKFHWPGRATAQALTSGLARRIRQEWAGSPMHLSGLARPRPRGLGVLPVDPRPSSTESGEQLLAGTFDLAGTVLHLGERADPWDRPSPNRRFAVALHRFGWAQDLVALGEEGQAEALRLTLEWRRLFGRWNSFSWSSEVLERRVFNLACTARAMCTGASEVEVAGIALDLARQARHLLACDDGPARAAERAVAVAIAGAALSGPAGEDLAEKALLRLENALADSVAPDGGHATRSPQAALELLFDLMTLDDALVQWGVVTPDEVLRAIDRLSGAVHFFTLADGALPAMQGGEARSPDYVAAACASAPDVDRSMPASRNGYHRLDGKTLQVVADAAPPAPRAWSVAACAQPLAIEVLANRRRLIVNAGWSADASAPPALRLVDAASTASLGEAGCGEPLRGFQAQTLGPQLIRAYEHVDARRQEGESAMLLELAHDGWARRLGLRHERRLYLDLTTDELRGEDRFAPMGASGGSADRIRRFTSFTVRFHLHPDVSALLARDRKSVLLRVGGEDAGWWLRNDAIEVEIEPSTYYENGEPRRSNQIVLRGQARMDTGARVRWKLAAAEAARALGAPPEDRRINPR